MLIGATEVLTINLKIFPVQSIPQRKPCWAVSVSDDILWLSCDLEVLKKGDAVTSHQPVRRVNKLPVTSYPTAT